MKIYNYNPNSKIPNVKMCVSPIKIYFCVSHSIGVVVYGASALKLTAGSKTNMSKTTHLLYIFLIWQLHDNNCPTSKQHGVKI